MFHYMLGQLHAYYIILQAFTVDFMQLQALHASSVGPWDFELVKSCNKHVMALACNETFKIVIACKLCNIV